MPPKKLVTTRGGHNAAFFQDPTWVAAVREHVDLVLSRPGTRSVIPPGQAAR